MVSEESSDPTEVEDYEQRIQEQGELIQRLMQDLKKEREGKGIAEDASISIHLNDEDDSLPSPQPNMVSKDQNSQDGRGRETILMKKTWRGCPKSGLQKGQT